MIAHPTPGLREALGEAGTFVDRSDVSGWVEAIRRLYCEGPRRARMAAAARARSAALGGQARTELAGWVNAVFELHRCV